MSSLPTLALSNGPAIPSIGYGLGTARYKSQPGDLDQSTIDYTKLALKTGFNHLDGAEVYGNEEELGIAISESKVSRSSIFLTTKIQNGMGSPSSALKESLKKLQTDYVDLYLIHIPFFDEAEKKITLEEVWLEMEKLQKQGLAKAIGVSNFREKDFERIFKVATIKPAINQIEMNPYLQSPDLLEYHKKHNVLTAAYNPLAPITKAPGGPLDPVVEKLCKKYNKTNTQILLRWALDLGAVVITTSSKESRMKEALGLFDFKLDQEEVEEICKVGKQKHVRSFWQANYKD